MHLLAALPATKADSTEKISLELLQLEARQQVRRFGPEAQTYLQWQIDCYTFGTTRAKELTASTPENEVAIAHQ